MTQRFIFASDLHGDQLDKKTVKALVETTREFKPHLRIFGGDLMDARPLRKGASREERAEGMLEDWKASIKFLEKWRPTHALLGNHDKRIYDLAEADRGGIESEYALKGTHELEKAFAKVNCLWLPYHKSSVWKFGNLSFSHGFFAGVNACRQMANIYGNCIFGHIHAVDQYSAPSIKRRVAMSSGCMCSLDMKWSAHMPSTLRHRHGFIMGIINEKTGCWSAWQIEEVGGKWHIPKGIRTI